MLLITFLTNIFKMKHFFSVKLSGIPAKKAIDIDKNILKSKKTLQLTSIHAIIISSGQVYPPNRLSIRAARTPPQS